MPTDQYAIFDDFNDGIQIIDPNWNYIYVNTSAALHGKAEKEQFVGYSMKERYPEIHHTELFHTLQKCMLEHSRKKFINEFSYPDGSKAIFKIKIEPVPEGLLIISSDLSSHKKLEIELRNLAEELEQKVNERTAELLKSLEREKELNQLKSRFVSIASHEFKTPLSTILSSISLIEKYTETTQQNLRLNHITKIKRSVDLLSRTLNEFLSIDRIEQGNLSTETDIVDVKEFLHSIAGDFDVLLKEKQNIIILHCGKKTVTLDKNMFEHVIHNILSNAIKYSEKEIEVSCNVSDDFISVNITDKGIGIPLEDQKKIFSNFFRANNAREVEGTGLGLSIAKRYIDLMNGTIHFLSEPGKGTVFMLSIPQQLPN